MKTRRLLPLALLAVTAFLAAGCAEADSDNPPPRAKEKVAEAKQVLVGPNVHLEVQGKARRVLVSGAVCLREGQLEQFLTRKGTKEHEAIVAADVDARDVHQALLLAGAIVGKPVQFRPAYKPATGQTIKITLRYQDKGKVVSVPARSWIKNARTNKDLDSDWVFAGSHLVENPLDPKKKIYLANDGDVICVSNFETALLDLPIKSPKDDADRVYVAHTERIPPLETKVVVVLEPVPATKK
ncbi:MAG TPA: YdjY domain-containing protein [Gemmataceae bacterium]|jgi:hypothetical protein|nr:YdjY domain-containing protein [Gemmataceae bacterium]